jgi:hypothetical protein
VKEDEKEQMTVYVSAVRPQPVVIDELKAAANVEEQRAASEAAQFVGGMHFGIILVMLPWWLSVSMTDPSYETLKWVSLAQAPLCLASWWLRKKAGY